MEMQQRMRPPMNYSNTNLTRQDPSLNTAGVTLQLLVFSITFLLGVVGNILLVATVKKRQALHKITYYLVSALAVGDLVTLITYGLFIPQTTLLRHWFQGVLACSVYSFLIILCGFSAFHLVAVISLDRYIACCRPLRYFDVVTPRRCAVASSWIFALVLTIIMIVDCKVFEHNEHLKNCQVESSYASRTRDCMIVPVLLSGVPCFSIIAVCQWKILKQARRVSDSVPANVTFGTSENTSGNGPSKATKTVSLITGTFLICCFPYVTVSLSGSVLDGEQSTTFHVFRRIAFQIFLVSKFANPIIYGIYNREFRRECRKLFPCLS